MKNLKKIVLIATLILILLVVEVVIVKSASKYEPEINIVYAKTRIETKTVITKEMLATKKINVSMAHIQAFGNESELIGKTARTDIEAGEMVLRSRIGKLEEMAEIKVMDENNRLYTISLNPDQANGWWVLVGQAVDIIFVPNPGPGTGVNSPADMSKPTKPGKQQKEINIPPIVPSVEEIIALENGMKRLNNIRVAAIIDDAGKQFTNGERIGIPKLISFEVTAKQDEFLAWAKGNGRLEVSVRPGK